MTPGRSRSQRVPRRAGLAVLLGLALLLANLPARASTILMFLNYTAGGQTVSAKVKVTSGPVSSPSQGVPLTRLDLRPGDTVSSDNRPPDRTVSFYSVSDGKDNLLFFVKARYYSSPQGGWVPYFQLAEQPLVTLNNQGQAVTIFPSMSSAVMAVSGSVPNIEGYFPYLDLQLSPSLTINTWEVR
jgi:hypothetical protein